MIQEGEISHFLSMYRASHIEAVNQITDGTLDIKARIPRSVTCKNLPHASPSDITLVIMQAAYVLVGSTVPGLPEDYQDRALFLRHRARYANQNVTSLNFSANVGSIHSGRLSMVSIDISQLSILEEQLVCGISQEEPMVAVEQLTPRGAKISGDQIAETLSIYSEEVQSDVVAIGYDSETGVYEAAIYFPHYTEISTQEHISARQMIEALMKAAYCGVSDMAFRGELPLTYQEFLDQRLLVRTREHNLGYRKLLAPGSQSLVHFQLSIEGTDCIVRFTHRPKVLKKEESFATGSMTFYLPDTKN